MSKTIPLPIDYKAPAVASGSKPNATAPTQPSLPYMFVRPATVPTLPSKVQVPEIRDGSVRVADLLAWLSDEAHEASKDPEGVHVYSAYMNVIEALR